MHLRLEPLPTETTETTRSADVKQASRLAEFLMFAQHTCLLDLSKQLSDEKISFSQFFLLGFLAHGNCLTMNELSAKVGRSGAASTSLVSRLEKLGYVQRVNAPDDRRVVMVQITVPGSSLVNRMREQIEEGLLDMLDDAPTRCLDGFATEPNDVFRSGGRRLGCECVKQLITRNA